MLQGMILLSFTIMKGLLGEHKILWGMVKYTIWRMHWKHLLFLYLEFGSLTTSQLMEKVRGLQNLAFQLGLDEGKFLLEDYCFGLQVLYLYCTNIVFCLKWRDFSSLLFLEYSSRSECKTIFPYILKGPSSTHNVLVIGQWCALLFLFWFGRTNDSSISDVILKCKASLTLVCAFWYSLFLGFL